MNELIEKYHQMIIANRIEANLDKSKNKYSFDKEYKCEYCGRIYSENKNNCLSCGGTLKSKF